MHRSFATFLSFALTAASACSSGDVSNGSEALGDAGSITPPNVAAADLGASCSGGCLGSEICTVKDDACESGACLFDKRDGTGEAYCTADCSNAKCPSGFVCENVPLLLSRACVRNANAPVAEGEPRVKGTVTVDGSVGALGTPPKPFSISQAVDTTPLTKLGTDCGNIFVKNGGTTSTASGPAVPGFHVDLQTCGAARAWLHFEVPFTVGSGPKGFPAMSVQLAPTAGDIGRTYDEGTVSISVTSAEGVDSSSNKYSAKKLTVHFEGSLPQDKSSCGAGSSCSSGGPTVEVAGDLEFANVTAR